MAVYRLFHLERGRLIGGTTVEAADDLEAIALAQAKAEKASVEIWRDNRRVHRIEAGGGSASLTEPERSQTVRS